MVQKNDIVKRFQTFKQLQNRLSSHKFQELNPKTIKIVAHNKTYRITAESSKNHVTSSEL